MKIHLNEKTIIIAIENLKKFELLFQLYILSLLCTEDLNVYINNSVYGVYTETISSHSYFNGHYKFVGLQKKEDKNPLFSKEPIRETSIKKQKKFMKALNSDFEFFLPLNAIKYYQNRLITDTKIYKIIQYENKISILSSIRNCNIDIYENLMKFIS